MVGTEGIAPSRISPLDSESSVFAVSPRAEIGALGGIRTLTDRDLNPAPLLLGYGAMLKSAPGEFRHPDQSLKRRRLFL